MEWKKTSIILLCSCLIASSVSATSVDDLENQREKIESEQKKLEEELKDVQSDISSLEKRLDQLTAEMKKTSEDIRVVENNIEKKEKEIKETENEIVKTEIELEEKKVVLAKSLRTMYSRGKVSYMEFLFRADDVTDFLYRFSSLQTISEVNHSLYEDVRNILQVLEEQKRVLEKQKSELVDQKEELEVLQVIQEDKRKQQLSILKELSSREDHLHEEIDAQERAVELISQEIADELERQRIERERREQEQRDQGNTPEPEFSGDGTIRLPMNPGTYFISSYYGMRVHPVTGVPAGHNGVDFAAPHNTPIYAVESGNVLFAGPARGYGNWVVIHHPHINLYSIYGHMYGDGIYVNQGQSVQRGQHIAGIGNAGTSTGYHLHLSIATHFNGSDFTYDDPMKYFE